MATQKKKRRRRRPEVKLKVATEWMSKEEAMEYLRLTNVRALYHLVENRGLPAYRLGAKNLIFSRTELDQHIRRQSAKAPRKRKPS